MQPFRYTDSATRGVAQYFSQLGKNGVAGSLGGMTTKILTLISPNKEESGLGTQGRRPPPTTTPLGSGLVGSSPSPHPPKPEGGWNPPQSLTVIGAVAVPPPRIRRVHGVGGWFLRPESGLYVWGGGSGAPILYRKKQDFEIVKPDKTRDVQPS